jgi:hypothetical protein
MDVTEPQSSAERTAHIGRAARYALADIRIVNGSVALIMPAVIIHASDTATAASVGFGGRVKRLAG